MSLAGVSFAYGILFMSRTVASSCSQTPSEKTHSISGTVAPYWRPFFRYSFDCGPGRFTSVWAIPYVHLGMSPPAYAARGRNVQIGVERIGFEYPICAIALANGTHVVKPRAATIMSAELACVAGPSWSVARGGI